MPSGAVQKRVSWFNVDDRTPLMRAMAALLHRLARSAAGERPARGAPRSARTARRSRGRRLGRVRAEGFGKDGRRRCRHAPHPAKPCVHPATSLIRIGWCRRCRPSGSAAGFRYQPHEDRGDLVMTAVTGTIRNGVNTEQMFATLDLIKARPELAQFQFRASNRWIDGAHNRSTIKSFYAAGGEDASRSEAFELDAGEPAILLGTDTGPNPAEYLLHALAACLTTTIVYVAAARKVQLTSVESTLTGDMDVRGALGVVDEPRNGFERIGVSFRITGNAPEEKLREVVERAKKRSAVYDMVTNGVPVSVDVTAG